jgi:lipoate-protein ligase A
MRSAACAVGVPERVEGWSRPAGCDLIPLVGKPALDLLVQRRLPPRLGAAVDGHLLRRARAWPSDRGVLRVYDLAGDVLSLGRHHLRPDPAPGGAVTVVRRHSGGRAAPAGDGFVGVSLVLAHRSALVAPGDPHALAPAQVMNRCVRGILEGCALAGVPAFYPGRDLITRDRRVLGLVSFDVDPAGPLLFEAILAVRRDFAVLPARLDAADPAGVVRAEILHPEATTSLAAAGGEAIDVETLAATIARGYATRFGVTVRPRSLDDDEEAAVAALAAGEYADARWLDARRPRPDLPRRAATAVQLGVLEVHLAEAPDGRIAEAVLAGDLLADAASVAAVETALRGCPTAPGAVEAAVARVFADPDRFVLGIGPTGVIAETVRRALGR